MATLDETMQNQTETSANRNVSSKTKSQKLSSTTHLSMPPSFSCPATTTWKSTSVSGASAPPEPSVSLSSSLRACLCIRLFFRIYSPPSPALPTVSSSATSLMAPVVDDLSALALGADLLIHYGHSCLVTIDATKVPCLYVFVDIKIDVELLISTIKLNLNDKKSIVLAGTIQFASAIREAMPELEKLGLSAFMIANPEISAFRYDPYLGKLFLEEYDHQGMKETRKRAIGRAREAKSWGIVLGTLGRQGNPRILDRGIEKPLLTFEAEIAVGDLPGWWEKDKSLVANSGCCNGLGCGHSNGLCSGCGNEAAKDVKGVAEIDNGKKNVARNYAELRQTMGRNHEAVMNLSLDNVQGLLG
ncbi:hypothetical protein GH714_002096 [Hevea brasiliensis]|uniref:2-(3-amino-3-carboxypropyl)histidine synthase subunit 1 n=1 Tax=Hevea brasiliensis TaxID=3981 RepID=A0A6A6M6S9_HEVBR|nr:hypothetical protein GH714_002096 [Hevea brasiliensis]